MTTSYEILANQPIVIDNGSGMIKAGFAGETKPKVVFPNIVGRPKFSRAMAGALEGDMFIGESARESVSTSKSTRTAQARRRKPIAASWRSPIQWSMALWRIGATWRPFGRIFTLRSRFVFSSSFCTLFLIQLQVFPNEHPVLLTEAPLNPYQNRQKAAEIFFETFNVPALYFEMQVEHLNLFPNKRILSKGCSFTIRVRTYDRLRA